MWCTELCPIVIEVELTWGEGEMSGDKKTTQRLEHSTQHQSFIEKKKLKENNKLEQFVDS